MSFRYATTLNTRPFLYQETLQIARLITQGKTAQEIELDVYDQNLFQIRSRDRMKTFYNEINRRLSYLNEELIQKFAHSDKQTSKLILLWAILQRDRLFFEWMNEVVHEKLLVSDLQLTQKETAYFMAKKQEQNSIVAKWTGETIKRLSSAYHQTLVEAEFATKEKEKIHLAPSFLDPQLEGELLNVADVKFVEVLGGGIGR